MNHLLFKMAVAVGIVLLSDYAVASIYFPSFYEPILIGIVIAVAGYCLERALLRRGTVWIATAIDIVMAAIIMLLGRYVFPGVKIFLDGALLTAALFGIAEYFYHRRVVRSEPVK